VKRAQEGGKMADETVDLYLAMGCFWGAQKRMWQIPGVRATAVGYMGGHTPNPDYRLVCTGTTGHTETVAVTYVPAEVPTLEVLRVFWEHHDPTQGDRQGNDIGSQYRSAVFWTTSEQQEAINRTREAYDQALRAVGLGPITTEIAPVIVAGEVVRPFWRAEDYHQFFLKKNPRGYDCHAHTGILLPL
jgi:peptide-methionine (S)-S-oxide reductase